MENPPFEDVFPIQDGDFPLLCLFTGAAPEFDWVYYYFYFEYMDVDGRLFKTSEKMPGVIFKSNYTGPRELRC